LGGLKMWKCPKCGESIEDSFDACWNCGSGKDGSQTSNPKEFLKIKKENKRKKKDEDLRYPVLKTISGIYRILALIVAILSVIGFIVSLFHLREPFLGIPLLIGSLIGGAISVISLWAISEVIDIFIDIERNTRLT
jgi:Ca2+/Na+ antiporter